MCYRLHKPRVYVIYVPERVVVGFNKTVYMVEERQGHVSLPVVVKQGQLTERVLLQVTTEDRTTSGI